MDQKIATMDLFVEVRDARLPLSSINPAFERFSGPDKRAKRLIVYTKRDLADARFEQVSASVIHWCSRSHGARTQLLKQAFHRQNGDTVVFANARNDQDARKVLKHILRQGLQYPQRVTKAHINIILELSHRSALQHQERPEVLNVMMAGMPNVGKSSLLNALRRVGVHKGKFSLIDIRTKSI